MKKKTAIKLSVAAALSATIGVPTQPILAQELQLEEVIVTARRREENLQRVPISVTALSAQAIADAGLQRLQDISQLVPNVAYLETQSNKFTNFSLRGITSAGGLGNDPAIGVYVDEVYIPRDSGFNGDLLDIERVEVLKGPQGTLFGRNTTVGAINVTTKKPGEQLEGMLLLDVGDYDYVRYGGLISVPFTDTLAGKISFVSSERDGYLDNTFGGTVNDVDYWTTRGQLLWAPTDRLELLLTGNYREDESNGNNFITRFSGEPVEKDYEVSIPDPGFEDVEDTMFSLRVSYDFDNYTLKSVTSMQEIDESYVNDQDWTALDDLTTTDTREMDSWSQELRIESASDSNLTWMAGVYFFHQEFDVFTFPQSGADTIYAFFGLTDLIGSGIPPTDAGLPIDTIDILADSTIETDSLAFYVNGTYEFNEQWSVNAGIRYSEDEKDLEYEQMADPLAAAAGFVPFTLEDEQDDDEWTPTISVNWQTTEDVMMYAKYSSGYKAGGFNNSVSSSVSLVSFEPETLDAYELGLKSTWLDNSLRVNLAVFRMEYDDKQESAFVAAAGFQQSNAGEATSDGFELEVEWVPLDRWQVFGTVGYVDAEYDEYEQDPDDPANDCCTGNTLVRAPEWTANLGVQTDWDFTDGLRGMFRVDYNYQDDFFTRSNNDPFFSADSQHLIHARLGISDPDQVWEATLWGRNLTDEDNINSIDGASSFVFDFYHYSLIAPRTYGVELRYHYQ